MNVLIVVPWDQEYGGVASVVGNLATQLEQRGHNVWFLHPGAPNAARAKTTKWNFAGYELNLRVPFVPGAGLKSVAGFALFLPTTLLELRHIIARHKIDIVNIHYPDARYSYFAILKHLLRFKLVVSVHGGDLFPNGKAVARYPRAVELVVRAADMAVAPSESTRAELVRRFPQLQNKSVAIHNAVNMAEFEYTPPEQPEPCRTLLCVAMHNPLKAIDVLLRAFAIFTLAHPEVELQLVGDGPLRAELERLAQTLGVEQRVRFLGECNRADVRRLMHRCGFLVLPSRAEPFGIVILEALASKKAVVASSVGGIPEIIEHGQTGILVEPENSEALSAAMRSVWEDRDLADRLAKAGYKRVQQRFQWEVAGAKYESTYAALLS